MLNYIRSEFYRVFHGKEFYLFTGIVAALTVLMNIVLYLFQTDTPNFPYGSVRYSLNLLSGTMEVLFYMGAILTSFLFSEEHKSGTMKNTISFGVSRSQFFTGKCIVCCTVSVLSMIVIMVFYYGSAYLLLDHPGDITVLDRLRGVAANLPMAFASVILAAALFSLFKKDMIALMWWLFIITFLPNIIFLLGLKIDWLNGIAKWMPRNYLRMEVVVNMSKYQVLWDTPEGMAKCLIAGCIGIVVFYLFGSAAFRKKELV